MLLTDVVGRRMDYNINIEDVDDDDFSPQDAFNLFTPSIYRPGAKDRPDLEALVPPRGDTFTNDPSASGSVTFPAVGSGPSGTIIRIPSGVFGSHNSTSLTQLVAPGHFVDGDDDVTSGWILGEREDAILLPVVLSVIGLCAVLGNALLLLTVAGLRRMRTGPNLMLANVALADLVFVAVTVPVAVVNHATRSAAF